MANFTPPQAVFGHQGRTPSVSTMATADLASRDPMMADRRVSSGFGFDNYNYDNGGHATPYVHLPLPRIIREGADKNRPIDDGGYPSQPPSGAWSPAHQKYTQVNI